MSCCAPGAEMALEVAAAASAPPSSEEIKLASRFLGSDIHQTDLSVPTVHCGACIQAIEAALGSVENVESARVNLSTKRVSVRWHGDSVPPFFAVLGRLGYQAHLFDPEIHEKDRTLSELIRAVAVAGFAAGKLKWSSPPVKAVLQSWVDANAAGWFPKGANSTAKFMDEYESFMRGEAANTIGLISDVAHWKQFDDFLGADNDGVFRMPSPTVAADKKEGDPMLPVSGGIGSRDEIMQAASAALSALE